METRTRAGTWVPARTPGLDLGESTCSRRPRTHAERRLPRPRGGSYWYECYFRPRSTSDWASLGVAAGLTTAGVLLFAAKEDTAIARAGDVGQILNPVVAAAVPIAHGDWRSLAQFGLSFATTMGVTMGMKAGIEKRRPNSSESGSYPSGHTAAAFSGAAFLNTRYGPKYGVPAYVVAAYTALSRVYARRHYLDDVIAGAGVALISNWLWSLPFGLECDRRLGREIRPSWRVEFGFGTVWQDENDVEVPTDIGTAVDLAKVEGMDDRLATARVSLQWFPTPRSDVMVRIDPVEMRGIDTFDEPIRFGSTVFPAGTELFVRWLGTEYKARWRYEFLPRHRRLSVRAGITAILTDYLIEMNSDRARERVGSIRLIPAPHGHLAYEVLKDVTLRMSMDGIPGVEYFGFDVEGALRWSLSCAWDVGLLYRLSHRLIGGDIDSDPWTQGFYLMVGRSF